MTDAADFERYRPLLFGIAYRMLGSAMEAEDMVQEAFLRYQQADLVEAPKAYLSKTVTNLCLDFMKSAATQREMYVGPWLPEPLPTPDAIAESERMLESISMAFLLVMERLSPLERAVFLLREVFDYEYAEIADILGKEESACRQLLHRAKTQISAHRPRFRASPEAHREILGKFILAMTTGDLEGLTHLLASDAIAYSDGGGKVRAATKPIYGRDAVARFMIGLSRFSTPGMVPELRMLNGQPAVIVREGVIVHLALMLDVEQDQVGTVRIVVNPDKLKRLKRL